MKRDKRERIEEHNTVYDVMIQRFIVSDKEVDYTQALTDAVDSVVSNYFR